MSKIYIIRHGQTIWNVQHKFQGWQNSELTKIGKMQADLVGKFLLGKNIDKVFCSPLKRTQDTLAIIKFQNPNLNSMETILDLNLRECHYGIDEGVGELEVKQRLLVEGIDRTNPKTKFEYKFTDGESYGDHLERIKEFVGQNNLMDSEYDSIIVCHMGSLKFLTAVLQNKLDLENIYEIVMWRPNNSVVVVFDTITKYIEIIDVENSKH